jgi:hypothetical protein
LTERWRGLIQGIDEGPDKFVWLEWEWVKKEISEEFIGFIKSTRQSGTEGYVRIPKGLVEDQVEDQTQQMLKIKPQHDAPVLKYKRCWTIEDNDCSCVLKSAASALSYLGYDRLAFQLCNDLNHGRKKDLGFEYFQNCMNPTHLTKQERKTFQFCKVKKGLTKWDILQDSKNYLMCLVGTQSSDHKTDHAISIVGKWIFDSNFDRALPLTKESLDLCCSLDTKKCTFEGVTRVSTLKCMVNNV